MALATSAAGMKLLCIWQVVHARACTLEHPSMETPAERSMGMWPFGLHSRDAHPL